MKKLTLITLLAFSVFAIDGDPNGWSKARWDMNEAQVAKAFSGTPPTEIEIGAFKYSVKFKYDEAGKLEQVMLICEKDVSVSVCYADVVTKLKTKYGKPETEESDTAKITNQHGNAVWAFKKSKIIVKMAQSIFGEVTSKFMYVRYQKAGVVEKGSQNL